MNNKVAAYVYETKNYDLFEAHPSNRDEHEDKHLLESIKNNGFIPSSAIHVMKNGNGKLKIIRGHHRFEFAKRCGIPVMYIIDGKVTDIWELEGGRKETWTVKNFLNSYARTGIDWAVFIKNFMEEHHLNLVCASNLIAGNARTEGGNIGRLIMSRKFKIGDMVIANKVVKITDICYSLKIPFATATAFVNAISALMFVPEFDKDHFIKKLKNHYASLRKRSTRDEYLEEIECFYNKGQSQKIPLKFRALEILKERQFNLRFKKK